jgi:hypothetical protein
MMKTAQEAHDLNSSPSPYSYKITNNAHGIRNINSEMRSVYKILTGQPERKQITV